MSLSSLARGYTLQSSTFGVLGIRGISNSPSLFGGKCFTPSSLNTFFMLFVFFWQGWHCILLTCILCPLLRYTSWMHPYFFPLGEVSGLFLHFLLIVIDPALCLAELDSFYLDRSSLQLGLVPIYPRVKCIQKWIP